MCWGKRPVCMDIDYDQIAYHYLELSRVNYCIDKQNGIAIRGSLSMMDNRYIKYHKGDEPDIACDILDRRGNVLCSYCGHHLGMFCVTGRTSVELCVDIQDLEFNFDAIDTISVYITFNVNGKKIA